MKTRSFAPDLIRAVAAIFVLGTHSFMYNGFYDAVFQGAGMTLAVFVRMAMITCVPLFIMLTGYLCLNKKFSAKYYLGIVNTLVLYVIASFGCVLYRVTLGGETISFLGTLRRILEYSAAPYGWYVEMYIGLFLLIPFINAGWSNMSDTMKKVLIVSLVFISSLYTVANRTYKLVPDWWSGLYPITYYVIGAWLREHPIKWRKRWLLLGYLLITAVTVLVQFDIFGGGYFGWSPSNNRGSILIMGETVMLFSLFLNVKGEKWPRWTKWCVARVARLSFGIYLFSYISDMLIYPIANRFTSTPFQALCVMPLCVAAGLVMSSCAAQVAELIAKFVIKAGGKILSPLACKVTKFFEDRKTASEN